MSKVYTYIQPLKEEKVGSGGVSQITDFEHTHQELIDLIDALTDRIDALENPVV